MLIKQAISFFMLILLGACSVTASVEELRASIADTRSESEDLLDGATNKVMSVEVILLVDRDLEKAQTRYDLHHYYLLIGRCSSSLDQNARLQTGWETLTHRSTIKAGAKGRSSEIAFDVSLKEMKRFNEIEPYFKKATPSDFCLQAGAGAMWGATFSTNQIPLNEPTKGSLIMLLPPPE